MGAACQSDAFRDDSAVTLLDGAAGLGGSAETFRGGREADTDKGSATDDISTCLSTKAALREARRRSGLLVVFADVGLAGVGVGVRPEYCTGAALLA